MGLLDPIGEPVQRSKRPSGTFKRSAYSASPQGTQGTQGQKTESAFLEPLTSSIQRKRFIVYDIESKDDDTQQGGFTRPFLVGMHNGNTYLAFRNEAKVTHLPWETRHYMKGGCIDLLMRALLTKKNSGCNVFAHNGGNFDHLFLLAWIRRHHQEFGFEVTPVQSSIQKLEVWKKEKGKNRSECEHWTFLDSVRLLPMSLEKAAKTFGLAGKEEMNLNEHEDHAHWELYLRVDCEQLFQVMMRLHELIEDKLGGEVGMTAPSTSMKLFRKRFLGQDGAPMRIARHAHWQDCKDKEESAARTAAPAVRLDLEEGDSLTSLPAGEPPVGDLSSAVPQCKGCAHSWIRRAYYGGRTEIFRMYGEKLHYYDINSSYVAAMAETMPVGDRIVIDNPVELDWRMHEKFIGFVECTVRIPEDCPIPPLPYRATTGKLIFPVGEFEGTWDTEELNLLRDPSVGGEILSIKKVVWFGRRKVFHNMVAELWRLRDKSLPDYDEGLSALAKLMGNSLYGKFGMKEERQAIVIAKHNSKPGECFLCDKPATTPQGQMCSEHIGSKPATGSPDCDVWYQAVQVSAPYIIPHIAAHITSLARVRIWKFMMQAHHAGGKLFYTDTDSLITDVVLPSSSELGALKDEYPGEMLKGAFVQPKVYLLEKDIPEGADEHHRIFNGEHLPDCKDKKCKGCADYKLAMKGFSKNVRTRENLAKLQDGKEIEMRRLQKVRSLAQKSFLEGPRMVTVTKSFKSGYDKRRRRDLNGQLFENGMTKSIVLSLPKPESTEDVAAE